ncbi:uncharacterized protein LOC131954603 [Physella acuta]|uniref:uncharacterized protein LOC131954603 n=1 Tax=Physella acuta TaxID=109671 RepID=UPI0027DD7366|nr:uncharacterized protein LOC131954603 [Physella acuta]
MIRKLHIALVLIELYLNFGHVSGLDFQLEDTWCYTSYENVSDALVTVATATSQQVKDVNVNILTKTETGDFRNFCIVPIVNNTCKRYNKQACMCVSRNSSEITLAIKSTDLKNKVGLRLSLNSETTDKMCAQQTKQPSSLMSSSQQTSPVAAKYAYSAESKTASTVATEAIQVRLPEIIYIVVASVVLTTAPFAIWMLIRRVICKPSLSIKQTEFIGDPDAERYVMINDSGNKDSGHYNNIRRGFTDLTIGGDGKPMRVDEMYIDVVDHYDVIDHVYASTDPEQEEPYDDQEM